MGIYESIREETRRKELTETLYQVNKTAKRIKANLITRFSFSSPEVQTNTSGEQSTEMDLDTGRFQFTYIPTYVKIVTNY